MVVSMDILISEISVFMDFAIVMCNALYFFVSIFGFINDMQKPSSVALKFCQTTIIF